MLRGERIREKMKKKIIIAGICIIALCAVIVPKFTKPKQFAQAVALPVMDAEKPETGDIRLTTSVIGKIEPSDVVYIYPKAAGDVTEVNVKAGDIVTKGQVLCNIDTKQVESAKKYHGFSGINITSGTGRTFTPAAFICRRRTF